MKLIRHLILTLFIATIMFSGCIETQPENTVHENSVTAKNALTIADTPVKYVSVNGIDIGYREFGSGSLFL